MKKSQIDSSENIKSLFTDEQLLKYRDVMEQTIADTLIDDFAKEKMIANDRISDIRKQNSPQRSDNKSLKNK